MVLLWVVFMVGEALAEPLVLLRQNSEPKYLANGQGLCDQIYSAVGERLRADGHELRVDPSRYPIKRILQMLEAGQGQLFCGAEATAERRRRFGFSALPAYTLTNVIASHPQQPNQPLTIADITANQQLIGALYGTSSANWLKSQIGEERVFDQIYSVEEGLALLAHHKEPRYFFYHDLALNYFAARQPQQLKVLPYAYRAIPQWLMFSPSVDAALIRRVDAIMAELAASGRLAAIQLQFLPLPAAPAAMP